MVWEVKYVSRLLKEINRNERNENGRCACKIFVADLMVESGLSKSKFYERVFKINGIIGTEVTLYLKGYLNEKPTME